ncbi:chromosome partitioning protein ParA [Leptolyngbya valderiana BDU 20041]|nr:AAA family ATPase [Geitlerinema sp. CS-897]OAB61503.1 chromosome partitioning protein ParA [Leptolyngbya valderiana BDU 20041]PPT05442.1 ParA family protein [Geitlerinema sp. FC II]
MNFQPSLCRNESEVESKLIVQYLLPQLGYPPNTWHQEVAFGSIRLDFLAFATQVLPFVLDANSPLSVVFEAKSPRENLDSHVRKLQRYLTQLQVRYGLLTNGKEIRIYHRKGKRTELIFQCLGDEVSDRIDEIRQLVGRDSLKHYIPQKAKFLSSSDRERSQTSKLSLPEDESITIKLSNSRQDTLASSEAKQINQVSRKYFVKIIAVYHNKGGVGKTTTVVNLAAALRKQGKRVLVVDLDSQANTTFAAGLVKFDDEQFDDIKDSNIYHVIDSRSKYSIPEVARTSQFCDPEFDIIPAHISLMEYERKLIEIEPAKKRLYDKLRKIDDRYDIVIIDTPPSLNLYARIALITADYLIIPSDLKPFANEGLKNVKNFIEDIDEFRGMLGKSSLNILGVLPSKVSTNKKFRDYTLPHREKVIRERYGFELMTSRIFEREDLAKSVDNMMTVGDLDIPDPKSIFDYKPDSQAAEEFEILANEVTSKVGL